MFLPSTDRPALPVFRHLGQTHTATVLNPAYRKIRVLRILKVLSSYNNVNDHIRKMDNYKNTPEGQNALRLYGDIIKRQRPVSHHPKMDLTRRAKIFSPYDALRGFDEAIEEVDVKSQRIRPVSLAEEQKALLSDKLLRLAKGMHVMAVCFLADPDGLGNYVTVQGTIKKIDPVYHCLEIENTRNNTAKEETSHGKIEKSIPIVIRFEDMLDIQKDEDSQ